MAELLQVARLGEAKTLLLEALETEAVGGICEICGRGKNCLKSK